jgi:hypothetical protein
MLRSVVDAGVVIALLGLMFTVTTYWLGQRSAARDDRRQARAELTDVVSELTSMPRTYAQLAADGSVLAQLDLSSSLYTEAVVLVAQAETLVAEHPAIVRATDRFAIGEAFARLGVFDRGFENFATAEELASADDDYTLALSARRGMAGALFGLERPEEGRQLFESIVAADGIETLPSSIEVNNEWFTLTVWIRTETMFGNCAEASALLYRLYELAMDNPDLPAMFTQAAAVEESVVLACGQPAP